MPSRAAAPPSQPPPPLRAPGCPPDHQICRHRQGLLHWPLGRRLVGGPTGRATGGRRGEGGWWVGPPSARRAHCRCLPTPCGPSLSANTPLLARPPSPCTFPSWAPPESGATTHLKPPLLPPPTHPVPQVHPLAVPRPCHTGARHLLQVTGCTSRLRPVTRTYCLTERPTRKCVPRARSAPVAAAERDAAKRSAPGRGRHT